MAGRLIPGGAAMDIPQTIERLGFRKWYERELVRSHLHLVLMLLGLVGVFAAVEAYAGTRVWTDRTLMGLCAAVSAAVSLWALRRYLYLLLHAEDVAHQAVCPECRAYAAWRLQDADEHGRLSVRCERCARRWDIHV